MSHSDFSGEKQYRLSDFFNAHWDKYLSECDVKFSFEQYRAVSAIRMCRTAALGVDYYACPECGEIKEVYHSCKNRFCPHCSWRDTVSWADRLSKELMNLPHRHVVFTLPHDLIPLIKRNDKQVLNILLRESADTLKDWIWHKYKLRVGIISVLHTFGETKKYHPHVHMIVSWGGLDERGKRISEIKGEYVNYEFLKKKFRIKFEDSLVKMYNQKTLKHNFRTRIDLLRFLRRINQKGWVVHFEPPMTNPKSVIRYVGRYSKRACISEYKITSIEGDFISFRYKDYKTLDFDNKPLEKELKLHYKEFFPRLLQHVPIRYFRLVRYYGVYSTKSSIPEEFKHKGTDDPEDDQFEWENPFVCSYCRKDRIYIYSVIDKRPRHERDIVFDKLLHQHYEYKRA